MVEPTAVIGQRMTRCSQFRVLPRYFGLLADAHRPRGAGQAAHGITQFARNSIPRLIRRHTSHPALPIESAKELAAQDGRELFDALEQVQCDYLEAFTVRPIAALRAIKAQKPYLPTGRQQPIEPAPAAEPSGRLRSGFRNSPGPRSPKLISGTAANRPVGSVSLIVQRPLRP